MTAAELIVSRVDSNKPDMGLSTYTGHTVLQSDVTVAKNYLNREELDDLNRIVTMFLDHAEDMARQNTPMYMNDWVNSLNEFLTFRRRKILQGSGKVSNSDMEKLALSEYAKYNTRRLKSYTQIDDESIVDDLNETVKNKSNTDS